MKRKYVNTYQCPGASFAYRRGHVIRTMSSRRWHLKAY